MVNQRLENSKAFYRDLLQGLYSGSIENMVDIVHLMCDKHPEIAETLLKILREGKIPGETVEIVDKHKDKDMEALFLEVKTFVDIKNCIKDIPVSPKRKQLMLAGIINTSSKELIKTQMMVQ